MVFVWLKLFAFALISTQTIAQITTLEEGIIGPSRKLGYVFKGEWAEEASYTVNNGNGNVYEKVSMYIRMGVGKLGWRDGTFIQSYASFLDTDPDSGISNVNSFTCSAEFNLGAEQADIKIVESFIGESSLTYTPLDEERWNDIAEEDKLFSEQRTWALMQGNEANDYKSSFENSKSWQYCSAETVLYDAINGMAPTAEMAE